MITVKRSYLIIFSIIIGVLVYNAPIAEGANSIISVEGESYFAVNFTGGTHSADTGLSNGDFLCLYNTKAPTADGYIATYQINVPLTGYYPLEMVTTPYNASFSSPYDIKINDGEYLKVDGTNAVKIASVPTQNYGSTTFQKYRFKSIKLNAGTNTVSFRVTQKREQDTRYVFYLDQFSVVLEDLKLDPITSDVPLNIFQGNQNKCLQINVSGIDAQERNIVYSVMDYWSNIVMSGTSKLKSGDCRTSVDLGALPKGHYRIEVRIDSMAQNVSEFFAVVPSLNERSLNDRAPFAVDMAASWLVSKEKIGDFASAIELAGVKWIRDRFSWKDVNTSPGIFNYQNGNYNSVIKEFSDKGINILNAYHDTPNWALTDNKRITSDLIASYEFAKNSASYYKGKVKAWEVWNEPDGTVSTDRESADQYAAYLKAAAIGYRDAGSSDLLVSMSGLAGAPGDYAELLMRNDILPYIDIYNFHAHRQYDAVNQVMGIPKAVGDNITFYNKYTEQKKYVWLSEAGVAITPDDIVTAELSHLQQVKQARYLVQSTVTSLSTGVDKHFWFIMPYYIEGGKVFGAFSKNYTPYAGYAAEAVMTDVLGNAVYAGTMKEIPEGVYGHIFRNGHQSVLVLWSENNKQVTIRANQATAFSTDIMGRQTVLSSANGSFSIQVGPDPVYLTINGIFPQEMIESKAYQKSLETPELTSAQRVVLTQKYPQTAYEQCKYQGYRLSSVGTNSITVDVYNFNNKAMTGAIEGKGYGGWVINSAVQNVSVGPFEKASITFQISIPPGSNCAPYAVPIVFQGTFAEGKTSSSVALIYPDEPTIVMRSLIPNFQKPSSWGMRITGGGTGTVTNGPYDYSVTFKYTFNGGDRWAYPIIYLPSGIDYRGTKGIACRIYVPQDFPANTVIRLFADETGGALYYTSKGYYMKAGWNQICIPWSDFSAYPSSAPDTNSQLDTNQINIIRLGINTKSDDVPAFTVKDLGVYVDEDITIYPNILSITPSDGATVDDNETTIVIDFAESEASINPSGMKVLIDGRNKEYTYDSLTRRLKVNTGVLNLGSHLLTVRFTDESNLVQQSVTVFNATGRNPLSVSFELTDANGKIIQSLIGQKAVRVVTGINSTGTSERKVILVVGLYDSKNNLQRLSAKEQLIPVNKQVNCIAELTNLPSNLNGYHIKSFVWNNYNEMYPLKTSKSFP